MLPVDVSADNLSASSQSSQPSPFADILTPLQISQSGGPAQHRLVYMQTQLKFKSATCSGCASKRAGNSRPHTLRSDPLEGLEL